MKDILKGLLVLWFVGIPLLAAFVVVCLAALAVAGAPLWALIWWING